ncbi:MAG: ABC transporter substrate-binding protein [Cellulosilyticaceae bacterium]
MKKKILAVLMTMMILLTFTACSNNQKDISTKVTTTDRAGNEIKLPEEIKSIISLAPSMTQTLVALGLGDKIIAIDTNSVNVEGIKKDLPTFDFMNPDVEKLVSLEPSVIMVSSISMTDGENPFKPITDLGISVVCVPTSDSIQGIRDDITFVSDITKTSDKGKEIITQMNQEIEKIQAIGKTITDKKSVYFEIGPTPNIYTFGKKVFLNEMIEIIGATNVFEKQEGWISAEVESVVNSNPDVILTNVNYIENATQKILSRAGWENMNAIKNKQVYYIDQNSSSLPNHNIVKALKEMAKAVYPDKY